MAQEVTEALDRMCVSEYLDGVRQVVPGFQGAEVLPPICVAETEVPEGFTDAIVWQTLTEGLEAGKLPADNRTLYVLFAPPGTAAAGDCASGRDILLWHEMPLRYAWITGAITALEQRSLRDAYTTHASRELVELCADPEGRGGVPVPDVADLNDLNTQEDLGLCMDAYMHLDGFLVHTYWSESPGDRNACGDALKEDWDFAEASQCRGS